MRTSLQICLAVALAAPAAAETSTFEADGEVVVVRGVHMFGSASFGFIGEPGAMHRCIALNASSEPIAVADAVADAGQILFQDLPVSSVDRVECREVR